MQKKDLESVQDCSKDVNGSTEMAGPPDDSIASLTHIDENLKQVRFEIGHARAKDRSTDTVQEGDRERADARERRLMRV
jgi:hypothetical protein